MLTRQLEAARDARLVPPLVMHPHHGPPGAIRVVELVIARHREG